MAFSIVALFILVLLLAGVIYGIVLWSGGGRSGGEMSCGGCGYSVRGLETLNCPECGADLRKVGINRGAGGGSRGVGVFLTLFCGGVLLLGCFGSFFFMVGSDSSSSPASIQAVPLQSYPTSPSATTEAPPAVSVDEPAEVIEPDESEAPEEPAR